MAGYDQIITRGSPTDPLVPEPIVTQVIQDATKASLVLNRARRVPLTSAKARQPVLSALPDAYWVGGDTGMKQTTAAQWENVYITAEELACIVPVPDALLSDAQIPIWDSVQPLLTEALGKAVDAAAVFGTNTPASWPDGIVAGATDASNVVTEGTKDDLAADVAYMGELLAAQGYSMNAFATALGFNWRLIGLRNEQGDPVYAPMAQGQPATLYGFPLDQVENGSWSNDDASLIGLNWSNFVVGVRQDVTFRIFSEGVISDDDGVVILNLMQQDAVAMRVVFRVGFQVANPINRINEGMEAGTYFPAAVLAPAGS